MYSICKGNGTPKPGRGRGQPVSPGEIRGVPSRSASSKYFKCYAFKWQEAPLHTRKRTPAHARTYGHTHAHTYTYTHARTHTQTHTHTNTHSMSLKQLRSESQRQMIPDGQYRGEVRTHHHHHHRHQPCHELMVVVINDGKVGGEDGKALEGVAPVCLWPLAGSEVHSA